jgi:hypothetical protein
MGSKARRTALSVAGIALAGGASLAFAGPASAATLTHAQGFDNVSYSSTKFEKTSYEKTSYSKGHGCDEECGNPRCDRGCDSSCDDGCDSSCNGGCDSSCNGGCGDYKWGKDHTKVVGFYRTYQECRDAARRGGWDNFDCDFTRKGYRGWHQSWNEWGSNDWRCHGTWVLSTYC